MTCHSSRAIGSRPRTSEGTGSSSFVRHFRKHYQSARYHCSHNLTSHHIECVNRNVLSHHSVSFHSGTNTFHPLQNAKDCILPTVRIFRGLESLWLPPAQFVPWARRSVAGLSSRRPGSDPRRVRMRFVVDKVALWQVSHPVLRLFASSTVPPMAHNNPFTHLSLTLNTLQEHEGDESFVITTVMSSVRQEHHFSVAWTTYIK